MSNFTTIEAAEKVGAPDAKTFRKFLRTVGYDKRAEEGRARYAFDADDVDSLTEQYAAYVAKQAASEEPENPFADAIAAYEGLTDKQRKDAARRLDDIDMNLNCNAAGSGRFEHVIVEMVNAARKGKRPVAKLTDAQVNAIIDASA
ncbi:hypothetical protein [Tsukamurella tyrosinosolvens]|uniref:hypothetical protein n=1 Tax=Tsukamurella tyrosinosolvens TaxID=57704 RepID=UPI000DF6DE29|nr:hypothetical protein [Tsukamurella tyrosinosolvens]RDB44933.1 hypothetical protein DVB87_25945 [Tsukamurella tyrosinosolvens]